MKAIPQVQLKTAYIPFAGGLDTETPTIAVEPGKLVDAINVYQGVNGGYITMPGYTKFDGRVDNAVAVAPTGTGSTLGGIFWKDKVYTFRTAANGLSAKMFVSSTSGWAEVALGRELAFTSGGTYIPADGDVIVGETSGATATVTRVVLEGGDWDAGDGSGRFIFSSQTGTFVTETLKIGTSLNVASVAGNSSEIVLAPGGRFEIIVANFTGSSSTERLYGCDGKNRGWEFDGTVFVPINTGMSADTPQHVFVISGHLVFSFAGSMQNSATGDPYRWTPYLGAAEIGVGDDITGFIAMPSSNSTPVTAVLSRNSIHLLYGSSRDDWEMVSFKQDAGALPWSAQFIGERYILDTRGVSSVTATDAYGNFVLSTLSLNVRRWLDGRANTLTDSCIMRGRGLYCLFFASGEALFCTVSAGNDGPVISAFIPASFPDPIMWVSSRESASGDERIFFGGASGNVYEFGVGTSFAGTNISWNIKTHFSFFKSPITKKRYRSCSVDFAGSGFADFSYQYGLSERGEVEVLSGLVEKTVSLEPTYFDECFFDECHFDGSSTGSVYFDCSGVGYAVSFEFSGDSATSYQLEFDGVTALYSLLKEKR